MQLENYTDVATDIILSSIKSAQDKKKPPIPIFLLVSMLEHADSPIPAMLISHKIDKNKILSEASAFIDTLHESHTEDTDEDSKVVSVDSSFVALLERANKSASDNGDSFVDTLTVFKQFYTEGIDNAPLNILRGVGLTVEKVVTSFKQIRGTKKVKSRKERSGFKTLEKYCTNMIKSANNNEFSPVIGREKEMRRIIQILCRKSKNNPIVIGESGVGKTAIVEGLAQKLSRNDVPDFLKGAELFELNMSALIGGAAHRGDLEKRVNELMDVVSDLEKNIILFIDEIHAIAKGGGKLAKGHMEMSLVATIDAALVGMSASLVADSLGLGGCMIGGMRNHPEKVAHVLGLPDGVFVAFGMTLGYPAKRPSSKPRYPDTGVIHWERYEDKPLKDRYSHIHDALQYLMLGSGEGRQVLGMNKKIETFNARVEYDVFNRRPKQQKRQGLWARM